MSSQSRHIFPKERDYGYVSNADEGDISIVLVRQVDKYKFVPDLDTSEAANSYYHFEGRKFHLHGRWVWGGNEFEIRRSENKPIPKLGPKPGLFIGVSDPANPLKRMYDLHASIEFAVRDLQDSSGRKASCLGHSNFDPYRMWSPIGRMANSYEYAYELSLENLVTGLQLYAGMDPLNARSLVDEFAAPSGPDGRPRGRIWGPAQHRFSGLYRMAA